MNAAIHLLCVIAAAPAPEKTTVVPFELLRSGHMAVQVKVNGQGPYRLIFDTGAPVTLLNNKIARAAGIDFWTQVMTQREFNDISRSVPVLVDARPFGKYSMVDIDAKGGLQVIIKDLLDAGFLDGDTLTCTGETLREQVARLNPPAPSVRRAHQPISRSTCGRSATCWCWPSRLT